jgi:hypothetical protein
MARVCILAAASLAMLCVAPALAADTTPSAILGAGGSASDKSSASAVDSGMAALGVDLSAAGSTAEEHQKFFSSQSSPQQALIRQRCERVNTTGSVANSDQPGAGTVAGSGAAAGASDASASVAGANVMSFCDDIK